MCLAIPMRIDAIDGYTARCSARGVSREVSTFLMRDEPLVTGEFVIVHLGNALRKVTPEEAQSTWELLDEMLRLEEEAKFPPAVS